MQFQTEAKRLADPEEMARVYLAWYHGADQFDASLLMPVDELRHQVNKRRKKDKYITFDDVLEIADFFGVSFETAV